MNKLKLSGVSLSDLDDLIRATPNEQRHQLFSKLSLLMNVLREESEQQQKKTARNITFARHFNS